MIRLQVLGAVELRGSENQEILSVLSQPKRTALLTFLAVATPRGFHRRDRLLGLFWPDLDQDRGRAALRKALHHLRRSLGDEIVLNRGDEEVSLNWAELDSDVSAFRTALAEGRPAQALEMFAGDLLEGFFLSGCPEFEHWLQSERDTLRTRAAGAGWEAAHRMVASGRVAEGERAAQRALELVPTNETQARSFMGALAAAGDRAAAIGFYGKFAAMLEETIELEPSEETRELLAEIRGPSLPRGQQESKSSVQLRGQAVPTPSGPKEDPGIPSTSPPVSIFVRKEAVSDQRAPGRRDRHMVEWGAAYIAGGWALIGLISLLDQRFGWPDAVRPTLNIAVVFASLLAMVLAWYHGNVASKRVTGPELLMVALLLLVLGIALTLIPG